MAEQLGVGGTSARNRLRSMVEQIVPAAEELYEQMVTENANLATAQPELRAVFNGEEAWLRGIIRIIITEMAAKLAH